jgi:hypothetical protein
VQERQIWTSDLVSLDESDSLNSPFVGLVDESRISGHAASWHGLDIWREPMKSNPGGLDGWMLQRKHLHE